MFHRFTSEASRALAACRRAARHRGRDQIGTAHLLMGLIAEWADVEEAVRAELGIDLVELHTTISEIAGPGTGATWLRPLRYAPNAKRALALANEESWRLDDLSIGTEHLLLGLLREHDGAAGRALRAQGAELDDMRRRVVEIKERELPGDGGQGGVRNFLPP